MMRSGVLATKHMPETHTGLHIAQRIDEIIINNVCQLVD